MNPYKIVTISKNKSYKITLHAKIKVSIVQISYNAYSKFYYVLLNLKEVVIFAYFNVTIYFEFELLNYYLVYFVN
jgi:hypothetical protein